MADPDVDATIVAILIAALPRCEIAKGPIGRHYKVTVDGEEVLFTHSLRQILEAKIGDKLVGADVHGLEGQVTVYPSKLAEKYGFDVLDHTPGHDG